MKQAIFTFGIYLALLAHIKAQSFKSDSLESNRSNHFAVGYNLNNFGNSFGVGLNLTSPYFARHSVAIRVSENYQWLSHPDNNGNDTWSGYHNIRIGVIGANFMLNNKLRLYGEGGTTILTGNRDFTSQNIIVGGYGLFGFEFYINRGFSYFIELGGIGTGATADKISGKPIYSNGFLSSVGFRINL